HGEDAKSRQQQACEAQLIPQWPSHVDLLRAGRPTRSMLLRPLTGLRDFLARKVRDLRLEVVDRALPHDHDVLAEIGERRELRRVVQAIGTLLGPTNEHARKAGGRIEARIGPYAGSLAEGLALDFELGAASDEQVATGRPGSGAQPEDGRGIEPGETADEHRRGERTPDTQPRPPRA